MFCTKINLSAVIPDGWATAAVGLPIAAGPVPRLSRARLQTWD